MIKDKAELDFEITAPLVWLAPKIKKGYIWLVHLRLGKSGVVLNETTKKEIIKWEAIWVAMTEQEKSDIRGIYSMKKTYGKLSKKGKWQFLKEIRG